MTKRFFALILCALMILPILMACNKKETDVPEGMMSVTIEGEPFVLYVPEEWNDNRDSGISSAYYSINNNIMASARYYSCDEETVKAGIGAYIDKIAEKNASLKGYELVERKDVTFGGPNGQRYEYKCDVVVENNELNITVTQYYTFYKNDAIVLSMYTATEKKSECAESFDKIRNEFEFCEKKIINNEERDKNTPEGMKNASDGDLQYVCYVPKSWVTDLGNKMTYAYVDESGKPNVTVTALSLDGDITAEQYFSNCEVEYKKNFPDKDGVKGYERLTSKPRKVAGCDAISYEYRMRYDGADYRIMQTVLIYNSLAYSITYTALDDSYDAHIDDVEKILTSFKFR